MSDDAAATGTPLHSVLNGHHDARLFVALLQCQVCSRPLQNPVTLPCGNSLCRSCLPPPHIRENVTYPAFVARREAVNCPFGDCPYRVHPLDDCSINVVFGKLLEAIKSEIVRFGILHEDKQVLLQETVGSDPPSTDAAAADTEDEKKLRSHSLTGGRLVATYSLADRGELPFTSTIEYDSDNEVDQLVAAVDTAVLESIQEVSQKELDCHVCYNLMLDPVTTPCGHTFCRKCLARILDHSSMCPVCRRNLPLAPSLSHQESNKQLVAFLSALYPEQVALRQELVEAEERSAPGGLDTALFVVGVTFPRMPLPLHVFEPRYRLMIRRALQSTGMFGVVAHNEHGLPQGALGRIPFYQYGVMVHIEDYHLLPDGRSLLYCRGTSRFRILGHGVLDGYVIARVQKVEDVSLPEEERIEIEETSIPATGPEDPAHLDRMSTQQLLEVATDFIRRARERSPHWLQPSIVEIYGSPPSDPAVFPYWFASVVPLQESEKYKLLPTTSVRERLKITARWVHKIDAQRWYV